MGLPTTFIPGRSTKLNVPRVLLNPNAGGASLIGLNDVLARVLTTELDTVLRNSFANTFYNTRSGSRNTPRERTDVPTVTYCVPTGSPHEVALALYPLFAAVATALMLPSVGSPLPAPDILRIIGPSFSEGLDARAHGMWFAYQPGVNTGGNF